MRDHGSYVLGAPEFIMKGDETLAQKAAPYSEQGLRVLLLAQAGRISSEDETIEDVSPVGLILISDSVSDRGPVDL